MNDRATLAEIKATWPATVPVPKASTEALGFSRAHGYDLLARGEFPVRVIKAGGRYLVVTAELVRLLSAGEQAPDAA